MHVFHIRGLSGLLMLLLAVIAAIALVALVPAAVMMVFWNAIVFEGFNGPEIDLYQGFLLWGFTAVMIKLIFKPEIQFQFQHTAMHQKNNAKKPAPLKTEQPTEEPSAPVSVEETPATPGEERH